jgi:protein-S-isoprenylcysteine O-methyltransferase Ste14
MNNRVNECPRILQYRPPRIAMTLLVAASLLQLALPDTWAVIIAAPVGGIAIGALGFGIMLRAWWLFRVHQTAICPTAVTTMLITSDVYRLTRNPMYLGVVLILLGVAIGTGGLLFYIAALAFFLIIDFAFCPYEEGKLEQGFGAAFMAYRERVRRWL